MEAERQSPAALMSATAVAHQQPVECAGEEEFRGLVAWAESANAEQPKPQSPKTKVFYDLQRSLGLALTQAKPRILQGLGPGHQAACFRAARRTTQPANPRQPTASTDGSGTTSDAVYWYPHHLPP